MVLSAVTGVNVQILFPPPLVQQEKLIYTQTSVLYRETMSKESCVVSARFTFDSEHRKPCLVNDKAERGTSPAIRT